jgi:DNA primase
MITQDTIGNILSAARIEEVVGDFVSLKRRGVNYIGLCPFHNEKTPSFTVSPAKGIFKCFGCGKAGNSVNFLMEHEHFTYPEALKFLAKRYRIEIEEEQQTPEKIQEQNEKESLFQLNHFAQQYFEETLFGNEEGKAVGLTYLKERGFREDTIRKFQLGYAKEDREDFSQHARDQGYKPEFLAKTGLSIQKEDRLFDRFHGRVIFPIHSASGRIIGFGGRILGSDKQMAKYLNSPESEIYNKSKSLYGLFFAKHAIVNKNNCFLVEGYTDVISLNQSGIENVVASSGTSLTQEQIKLILRYTPNITILYDGDPAGIKASMRGIDMILEQGMNVKIVLFPEGEDPDSFARKHRVAEVEGFIGKNAVNFILFKTRLLLEETSGDPIRKAALIKEIVSTIALIPDGISRSIYIKECSSMMTVPEQTLVNEMNKILRKRVSKTFQDPGQPESVETEVPPEPAHPQVEFDLNSSEAQEKELIRLLLQFGNEELTPETPGDPPAEEPAKIKVAAMIISDIRSDDLRFDFPAYQMILDEMEELMTKGVIADKDYFFHHANPDIARAAIGLSILPYELSEKWEENKIFVEPESSRLMESVVTAIYTFKSRKIDQMMADNQRKMKMCGSEDELLVLMKECVGLKNISQKINAELGRIVTR